MSISDLIEEIELMLRDRPLSAAELVRELEAKPGTPTSYDVISTIRGMREGGRLIEIKGKLYLQRGFGDDH